MARGDSWVRKGVVGLALGGVLLTGCSGGGTNTTTDSGAAKRPGGSGEALPAPAASERPDGQQESDEGREFVPPPDYLSTFALDVDTASYGYARRTLGEGRLPDPSTVRPEEFVNSFRQDYPQPKGSGISVNVDGAQAPGAAGDDWSLLRVGLATKSADAAKRPPAALTFVIDISGSMAEPGRLDLVKESLGIMTDRLRADDSVAIVTFSDEAETVLPMTRLAEDADRDRVHAAVDDLEPTDSTNLEAGIRTGYDTAVEGRTKGATNRVVLLSDALANTGATSADTILERISEARREHGITLFGVGVGSDYGDALMEQLADKGDGHTTYVSDPAEARKVFCDDLPAHIELRARDAKAQVAFDPKTVDKFRLIGYDNRQVADEDFRDDRVDGGEVGPGHSVTALYAVRLKEGAGSGDGHVATARVRWQDPKSRTPHERSQKISAEQLGRPLWDGADRGFQVSAVAAYFADALRAASYRPEPSGCPYDDPTASCPEPALADGPESATSGEDRFTPLPGRMSLSELSEHADRLAGGSDDPADVDVQRLATAVRQAAQLRA
ncbi:von Willebrand factor type A domain-containing protein [Streptomyces sp. LHD-70]|uniref:YfbK domain-containing protein n=1 Tax=Streptomyces sp. LHD-70 TaxID=3072140 RepID=UPI00280DEDCB|nr:von Willebrand factor type A domain-containing protein [Streptomyces sp. LHD-70]MDQ8707305.1 von Willebrand factor type A domain-containing protein [Streptomyces sp. LHD-70]